MATGKKDSFGVKTPDGRWPSYWRGRDVVHHEHASTIHPSLGIRLEKRRKEITGESHAPAPRKGKKAKRGNVGLLALARLLVTKPNDKYLTDGLFEI